MELSTYIAGLFPENFLRHLANDFPFITHGSIPVLVTPRPSSTALDHQVTGIM